VPSSAFGDAPGLLPTLSLQRRSEAQLDAAPALEAEDGGDECDGMDAEQRARLRRRVWLAVRLSLAANALLTTIWVVSFALTRSYAFLAALADCGMDVANQVRAASTLAMPWAAFTTAPTPGTLVGSLCAGEGAVCWP
jgi:hypothetical protein